MGTLVLLRHGQSQWNLENLFAGWSDDPPLLTERGAQDAHVTAGYLKNFRFDIVFTSRLKRANQTMDIILEDLKQTSIPIIYDSGLNERHYGELQGLNRSEMVDKYGMDQVMRWRRGYSDQPPGGESIEDCVRRVTPFFKQYIMPHIKEGKTVFVAAHGNSMRPIIKYLDNLEPDATAAMEVPLCTPYIYTFNGEKVKDKKIIDIPGIVTQGGSLTEKKVEEGRV